MDLAIVRSKSNVDLIYYIYYLLKTKEFQSYIVGFVNGTTVLHLDSSAVLRFKFVDPPDDIKTKFQNIANLIIKYMLNNSKENDFLTTIRDLLLPKLISGKIRVPVEG